MRDILEFWHRVEFFDPFDLGSQVEEASDTRRCLWRKYGDTSDIVCVDIPEKHEISSYTLFLGVFDKGDVRQAIRSIQTEGDALEEERLALEGSTCMASIRLSSAAVPMIKTFEVSVLPWAMGRALSSGLDSLTSTAFEEANLTSGF